MQLVKGNFKVLSSLNVLRFIKGHEFCIMDIETKLIYARSFDYIKFNEVYFNDRLIKELTYNQETKTLTINNNKQMKDETLFFHGTSVDGRRFTIAARFIKDRTDNDDLILGIAICSDTDQFVKKVGRNKAEGRLISEGFKGCTITSLYSNRFFKKYETGNAGFPENWFVGEELEIFIELCHEFEKFTFKELKEEFNLLF